MNKKIKTIGMVVAMDKEIKPFLESVGKPILAKKKGQFEIFGYKTKGKKIYLIKSGISYIPCAFLDAKPLLPCKRGDIVA